MEGVLELKGMRFHAYHGCLDFERIEGGDYIVDFSVKLDITEASKSDELSSTLNYAAIYGIVKTEMDKPSNLIENVAARIAAAIRSGFPQLNPFTIKLTKLAPPVGGQCDGASITIEG